MRLFHKFYISLVALGLMFMGGCTSYITDTLPTDQFTEDKALIELEDFRKTLYGSYSNYSGYMAGTFQELASFTADDVKIGSGNAGQGIQLHNWVYASTQGEFATLWATAYSAINLANWVIGDIDGVALDTEAGETEAMRNDVKGQALALRAICHFDLLRAFSKIEDVSGISSNLGVPVVTSVLGASAQPARNTISEVYDQIIADLTEAKSLVTTTKLSELNTTAIEALLARVYLYKGDYANAITSASTAITNVSLCSIANFPSVWDRNNSGNTVNVGVGGSQDGMIFRLGMPNGAAATGDSWWDESTGTSYFQASADLTGLYDSVNDVRGAEASASGTQSYEWFTNATDKLVTKFNGPSSEPGRVDVPVLRTGEMYLIRAEAYYRSGNEASALADLNALRTARINGYSDVTLSGTALELGILTERRKELCFEGHRWFDLRRFGQDIFRSDCNGTACSLTAGDSRFLFPIPQSEMDANTGMVQNSGY